MPTGHSHLKDLDYSVVQQCMHCGLCLPTCPTYDATKLERNSPRGRIALMRAIADDRLEPSRAFGEEMYFCLGCLACATACPAGGNYAELFEHARAEVEQSGAVGTQRFRVAMLTGCVQDIFFSDVNRDTVEVLARNGCEVVTPPEQFCCGSLQVHCGQWEAARELARKQIDQFPPEQFDAIITNS